MVRTITGGGICPIAERACRIGAGFHHSNFLCVVTNHRQGGGTTHETGEWGVRTIPTPSEGVEIPDSEPLRPRTPNGSLPITQRTKRRLCDFLVFLGAGTRGHCRLRRLGRLLERECTGFSILGVSGAGGRGPDGGGEGGVRQVEGGGGRVFSGTSFSPVGRNRGSAGGGKGRAGPSSMLSTGSAKADSAGPQRSTNRPQRKEARTGGTGERTPGPVYPFNRKKPGLSERLGCAGGCRRRPVGRGALRDSGGACQKPQGTPRAAGAPSLQTSVGPPVGAG